MSFVAYSSTTVSDISSNLILSVDTWYYLSTSNKTLVGGTWQTNPPTWEEHKYYWQKTITTYNNGTTTETKPVCITGGTGQPGTGIEQIVEEYAISDSKTIAPKTGWQGGTARNGNMENTFGHEQKLSIKTLLLSCIQRQFVILHGKQ